MKWFLYLAVFLTLVICPGRTPVAAESNDRPRIGLALSGGGARGGAHVGVLKALEELGIQVDYIAGTSMGAIVGGFYAAGYTANEIETIMMVMDWDEALSDRPSRRNQTMRKKELDAEFLIPYRIGFNNGGIQLPLGVIEGQHLDQILQRLLIPAQGVRNFDDLSIPFRAVATDLVTGKEVILSNGSLPDSLRASMSVPGVFAPVELNGRMLVDGGMSNNLPISVVRSMGADIVIAVDISSPLLTEEELTSVLSVTEQLTNFLTRNNTERQIATLGPGDFLVVPDLEGISSADFEAAAGVAGRGYDALMAERVALQAVLPAALPRQTLPSIDEVRPTASYVVSFIEIDNDSKLDDEMIRSRLDIEPGDRVELAELNRMVDQIYSLDVFQSVTYDMVVDDNGETGLVIHAIPRAWGPNYLQFGMEFSDDFEGSSDFKLGAAYTRNALNALGGELRVVFSIGREDELSIDFYQPIDKQARWFVEPELFLRRNQYNLWDGDTRVAILDISGAGGRFGIGRNFNTNNQARLSYVLMKGTADYIVGLPGEFPVEDVDIGEFQLEYRHDSLDDLWFPGSGISQQIGYLYAAESLGASADYQQLYAGGNFAWSRGKNNWVLSYELGYSIDDKAPIERWFELGGFARLSGLVPDQLSGRQLGLVTLAYYRRLNDFDLFPAYAGITLEAGNVWNTTDDVSLGDLSKSGSLFVGAKTPLGPVYLSWGYNSGGDHTLYFYLGNPFRRNSF